MQNFSVSKKTSETGWYGQLKMIFSDRQGITQVISDRAQAPLKVQRPFYPDNSGICHSIILHTAGGLVGGDVLDLNFHLHPKAKTLITTATASKIYRSNQLPAQQNIEIFIDSEGYLEWFPQETIIFNGAIYQQNLQVELAIGAIWLGWEITRFGRSARGERFLTGAWKSYTEISQQGVPLWIDRQYLPGGEELLNSPHGLGRQPVIGTLSWVGKSVSPETVTQIRKSLSSCFDDKTVGKIGVTRLPKGLLCRYLGQSSAEAKNWFILIWDLLRRSHLDCPSCPPRVW